MKGTLLSIQVFLSLIILGLPYAVKSDSNELCNMEENIYTLLRNNDHITVLLKGKF